MRCLHVPELRPTCSTLHFSVVQRAFSMNDSHCYDKLTIHWYCLLLALLCTTACGAVFTASVALAMLIG